MSLLVPFSSTTLRKRYYEVFLMIHILSGIVIVYALFKHISRFGTECTMHLWPVVALCALDRLHRIARLASCNMRAQSGRLTPSHAQKQSHIQPERRRAPH
ncbi:hypothetical protein BJX68DRAFT_267618 [Aspergillus pseudodeflectus]|uniref:Ferric oxidoreductase domain-containing protein n=1 Tax=Aspergillus pseudodeflectus TaxID=176178 RepID=A0ABR4K908_9EURO